MSDDGETGKTLPSSGKKAAKNRVAQQRFRQRQKEKREDVQRQLQILSRRLESLELQHKSLNERNRLLERLVTIKDSKAASLMEEQESARAPPMTEELAEKRAAALAKFINTVRRNKPPVVTIESLTQAVCEAMEPLKFEYVHNLSMLMGEHQREELTEYVKAARRAREEMMQFFDLRDLPMEAGLKRNSKSVPIPFKMSMVRAMQLSEAQKEALLDAKRAMTLEYEAIISERKRSTAELKKSGELSTMSEFCHKNHKHFVMSLADGLSANEAFMESLKAEHKCLLRFYSMCAELVTPLQEARCLVEGYADGMWVDFWVLPMIVEAERGNVLPAWLKEAYGEGTSQLTFNTLIGVDFHPSVPQPTGSEGVLVDASAQPDPGTSLNSSGSQAFAAQEGAGYVSDDFLSSLPLDYGMGFDNIEADMFGQLFPSIASSS